MSESKAEQEFPSRVVIAGGSIAGLFLAAALQSANIDFVVLERGPVIGPQLGASVGLHPHGNSIFDQLGLFQAIQDYSTPLDHGQAFDSNGNVVESDITVISRHVERFGYPAIFIQRCNFIKAIYDRLEDKSKVHVNKAVIKYEEFENGVRVFTDDGDTYDGTFLVGADGINSTVRGLMKENAEAQNAGSGRALMTTNGGKDGFLTEYKCLFGISRTIEHGCTIPPGESYWAYGKNHCTTAVQGEPGLFFWFLWDKTKPSQQIRSPRYTDQDAQDFVNQYAQRKMCGQFTVKNAWDARVRSTLVSQEEGILDQWSYGRAVMIGDAVHKMSVNAGLGAMCAVEGIVNLTNVLVPVMSPDSPQRVTMTTDKCEELFKSYRKRHMRRLQSLYDISCTAVRFEAQKTWLMGILANYVLPWCSDYARLRLLGPIYGGQPMFAHLPKDSSKPINRIKAT